MLTSTLSERAVEIPWALSRFNNGERVLEVGCSFASESPEYIAGLKALGAELHGIDISSVAAPDFIKRTADIRASGYPSEFFDMIFCISTLEHVGRDNTRHYHPVAELNRSAEPDRDALVEMLRILKRDGRLIVTVPFGKFEDHSWFINYDAANIQRVFRGVSIQCAAYFEFHEGSWRQCQPQALSDVGYNDRGAVAAAGCACFEITRS